MTDTLPIRERRDVRRLVLWATGLALLGSLLGYQEVLDAYFVSDDLPNLILSQDLQSTIDRLVSSSTGRSPNKSYRPLINWAWHLDFRLWGVNPLGFHLQNLAWHVATCVLLALLVFQLSGRFGAGLLSALLFAIHPIHPEAVTWISARGDLIVAVFSLATLLLLHAYVQKRGAWRLALSATCYWLALASKESAFSIPFMLLAYVAIYLNAFRSREEFLRALRLGLPFVAATLLYLAVRQLAIGFYLSSYSGWEPDYHFYRAVRAFSRLVLPQNWSLYDEESHYITSALLLLSLATVLIVVHLDWKRIFCSRFTLFMLALIAASLVPIYDIFQSMDDLQGTRYWYLATLGSCGLIALIFDEGLEHRGVRRALVAGCVLLFAATHLMILRKNNEPWAAAGDKVSSIVKMVDAGDPVRQHLLIGGDLDTIHGAYVLRNGFDRAIRTPFTKRDHYLFGRKPGMSPDEPLTGLANIRESVREVGPNGKFVYPISIVGKRSPVFVHDLLNRIEAQEISVELAATRHVLDAEEIRQWLKQRQRARGNARPQP